MYNPAHIYTAAERRLCCYTGGLVSFTPYKKGKDAVQSWTVSTSEITVKQTPGDFYYQKDLECLTGQSVKGLVSSLVLEEGGGTSKTWGLVGGFQGMPLKGTVETWSLPASPFCFLAMRWSASAPPRSLSMVCCPSTGPKQQGQLTMDLDLQKWESK